MPNSVTVRVPATSANLGSGYDSLGLALDITADVTIALESARPADGHSLAPMVAASARAAYRAARRPEPAELNVVWNGTSAGAANGIPIARGLGASAAARAAGLVGANALMDEPLSSDELLALGAELEGHVDNMAPALFGGLQITVREESDWHRLSVPLPDSLRIVLLIPDFEMPTRESRSRLPRGLPMEDAVFNIGRAALLVAALAQGEWELLDTATDDRLHQPARAEIFTALYEIIDAAKEGGAHGAYLSGGGSTIAAFATEGEERIARLMQQAALSRGYSGRTLITQPSVAGATVVGS
ncbi:MAG: homoserine kinase [Chloroflexi bacterium]|nr:homoserine kinase [Chloroflexota bacterium]